ncbi:MAG: hypothetical protein JXR91_02870 [Deltaproteobacteria bacterium]|nr:hypothetical protein [Deltaproteobacteria bacterium]
MTKKTITLGLVVLLIGIIGCKEEMVGAPCIPETDDGSFNVGIEGTTWSIETGSVQCATHLCLTQVNKNESSRNVEACKDNPSLDICWLEKNNEGDVVAPPAQLKFSFCSCRCEDAEGHKLSDNPDKYSDLCECPPSTVCEKVMDPIPGLSDKLPGSYCVPNCISKPCDESIDDICTPSKDSKEPWKWTCETTPDGIKN